MKRGLRYLSLMLGAVTALTLAGCGEDKNDGKDDVGNGKDEAVSIFSRPTVERPATGRKDWNDVDSFVCYYGSLTGDSEKEPVFGGEPERALDMLKQFDVAIIHSSQLFGDERAAQYVQELKDAGTYIISYLTIGEDDGLHVGDGLGENGYASYYLYENGMPRMNSSWGSYFVDAGNPVWQEIVLGKAKSILEYGVDGLFLDTLDTVDVAYDTMGGMVDLVRRLDEELPEGTKLVPNRGFTVYQYISQYVDGIMFESFSTTYDEASGFFVDRNEADMEYNQTVACNIINRVRRYDYMPVFCLDYINKAEYSYMPQNVYDNAWMYDFVPYATYSRNLDICPDPDVKPQSARGSLALSKLSDSTGETTLNGDTSSANLAYAGNELCTVAVDSTFVGYSGAKPLNDGFFATEENHNQLNWATESWASENNNRKDHWIQFTFAEPQEISKVNVYWAPDGAGTPTFYSAREARIEAMIDGAWQTVATYNWKNGEVYLTQQQLTEFTFDKITTDQIRIFQPKGMGDATSSRTDGVETVFTGIMWVSEVEIYA